MKTTIKRAIASFCIMLISACEKAPMPQQGINTVTSGPYLSVSDFLEKNATPMQTYTVYGGTGGTFTTPQGTVVTIPPNAFVYPNGNPVASVVTIQFKDIYKKSDMLLNNMPTMYKNTYPMKSAGEFYIKAIANGQVLQLNGFSQIQVKQPMFQPFDPSMNAFVRLMGLTNIGWANTTTAKLSTDSVYSSYIFALYKFSPPADSGTWCNSDNSSYFSAYTQTTLTLQPNDSITQYETEVFLLFKGINSMVHVYSNSKNFPYYYAPVGLQCTLVAIGNHNGNAYSAFVPITIGVNQTCNFSLIPTSTNNFLSQLKALN